MRNWIRHIVNLLLWPLPPARLFGLRRLGWRLAGINIADDACVCGRGWFYGSGDLTIGAETWLSPGVVAYTHSSASIHIGARCDIGPEVRFVTGGHEIGVHRRRAGEGNAHPIKVGDGCWIGAGAILLGGIQVGDGAVIAAGAVVREDVPPDSLVAGVPAIVKKLLAS